MWGVQGQKHNSIVDFMTTESTIDRHPVRSVTMKDGSRVIIGVFIFLKSKILQKFSKKRRIYGACSGS